MKTLGRLIQAHTQLMSMRPDIGVRAEAGAMFWAICYGLVDSAGYRQIPTLAARKLIARTFGLNRTLDEWRQWATRGNGNHLPGAFFLDRPQ